MKEESIMQFITAAIIKAASAIAHHTFLKVDKWAKQKLTRVSGLTLFVLLATVVAIDWAIAGGNAIPAAGAIISAIDAWLGPIDEIILAAWPTYRILYEVAVRWVRWFEARGLELPQGLKELASDLEAEGDKAHKAVVDKAGARAKAPAKPKVLRPVRPLPAKK